jgi:hypothetical protein
MGGTTFAPQKKQGETAARNAALEAVPRKKEVEDLRGQLRALDRQYDYLKQRLETARAANDRTVRIESMFLGRPPYDEEFLAMLMNARMGDDKPILSQVEKLHQQCSELFKKLLAAGLDNFAGTDVYNRVFIGNDLRWEAVVEVATDMHASWEKQQKQLMKDLEPKPYPTIGAREWEPPTVELPRSGTDLLYGERMYVGERGRAVPESVLTLEREIRSRGTLTPKGVRVELSFREFYDTFVPVLPSLDATITDVKVMWDKGASWKGAGSIAFNLTMAGLDVVLVGQLASRSVARVSGRELADSFAKGEGRLTMSPLERDVFETAVRELKPGELNDLFRVARPAEGEGLGWTRVFGDLALSAGDNEITGDVMRAYLREQTGATKLGSAAWRLKAGTIDFLENGLSVPGTMRFRKKVAAELFNELRMTVDHKAAKGLAELLASSGMPLASRRLASDAMFYTLTSFSKAPQRALLKLVEREGWPNVVARLKKEGLERMLPEYASAFRYAPMHRLLEYGVFRATFPLAVEAVQGMITDMSARAPEQPEILTEEGMLRNYFESMDRFSKPVIVTEDERRKRYAEFTDKLRESPIQEKEDKRKKYSRLIDELEKK